MRFLLSRRWILFAVTVCLLAFLAVRLGEWQFGRLSDREAQNRVTERNLAAAPVPVDRLLSPAGGVNPELEWRRVRATGRYLPAETVLVRYQTRDGRSGVDVVVPLVTESGPTLLVNRGWLETRNVGDSSAEVPAPPAGEVTIRGWVRADATGEGTQVTGGSTRAVSSETIAALLSAQVYRGFVSLERESPQPQQALVPVELPDLGEGPHFFYGLQWWFFAALALFGFGYLAWDEQRKARAKRSAQSARVIPPSTASIVPVTNEAAGDSRKAAARPNSSGVP